MELNRAAIVRHAIQLADADGLDAVSMRALAHRCGVPAMSLYRYVASKDDLVTAMVDRVLERPSQRPDGVRDWREQLGDEARREWELYQRHPWVLPVLATTRPPLSPSVIAGVDRSMVTLTDAGLDPDVALSVYLTISGYVQGAALLPVAEMAANRESGMSSGQWWQQRLERLAGAVDSGRYPWLTELAATPAARGPSSDDVRAWFEFGLQRVLDGVAVHLTDQTSA